MIDRRRFLFLSSCLLAAAPGGIRLSFAEDGGGSGSHGGEGSHGGGEGESGSGSGSGSEGHSGSGSGSNSGSGANSGSGSSSSSESGSSSNSGSSGSSGSGNSGSSGSGSGQAESGKSADGKSEAGTSSSGKQPDKGSGKNNAKMEQDAALAAVANGEIMSLKDALKRVNDKVDGKVIDVTLQQTVNRDIYKMKVRAPDGTIKNVKMDARTGKIAGLFGF